MHIIRTLGIAFLSFWLTTAAQAQIPKVSGKYATMGWHICQLVVTTPKSLASQVTGTLKVKGVTDIVTSKKVFTTGITIGQASFVQSVEPQTDTFKKADNSKGEAVIAVETVKGAAITGIGVTPGVAIANVTPASRIDFVTQVQTQNVSAVTGLEQDLNGGRGIISMTVGTATFPPAPGSTGEVSLSIVEVMGQSMRNLSNPGSDEGFIRNPGLAEGGSFSFPNATTLKVGTMVYDISVGNIDPKTGVARTLNLMRRPSANEYCADLMTLTKQ